MTDALIPTPQVTYVRIFDVRGQVETLATYGSVQANAEFLQLGTVFVPYANTRVWTVGRTPEEVERDANHSTGPRFVGLYYVDGAFLALSTEEQIMAGRLFVQAGRNFVPVSMLKRWQVGDSVEEVSPTSPSNTPGVATDEATVADEGPIDITPR